MKVSNFSITSRTDSLAFKPISIPYLVTEAAISLHSFTRDDSSPPRRL